MAHIQSRSSVVVDHSGELGSAGGVEGKDAAASLFAVGTDGDIGCDIGALRKDPVGPVLGGKVDDAARRIGALDSAGGADDGGRNAAATAFPAQSPTATHDDHFRRAPTSYRDERG